MLRAVMGTTATNVAIQCLNLVSGVLLARSLEPHGRGELATAMLWPSLIANIAIMGADVVLGRKSAERDGNLSGLYQVALVIAAILGAAFMVVGAVWLPVVMPQDKRYLLWEANILLATIPFGILHVLLSSIELARGHYRSYNRIRVAYAFLYAFTLTVAFAILGPSLHLVIWCLVFISVAGTLPFLFSGLRSHKLGGVGREIRSITRAKDVLQSALPFGLAGAVGHLVYQIPLLLLTYLTSTSAIGLFVVATSAANLHLSFGAAWSKVMFADALVEEETPVSAWLIRRFHQSVLAYVLISGIMMAFLPPLIPFVFGSAFYDTGNLTFWLIPVTSVFALALALDEALRARGVSASATTSKALSGLVMTSVALLTIPSLGVYGMVLALGTAALTELAVLVLFCTKVYRIRVLDLARIDYRYLVHPVRAVLSELRKKW